jgi:hypothetical protein
MKVLECLVGLLESNGCYTSGASEPDSTGSSKSGIRLPEKPRPTHMEREINHREDEPLGVDPIRVLTMVVPVRPWSSELVLIMVSALAPSRTLAFFRAPPSPDSPIPRWSRTSSLAGAGDANSGSVPDPVFGNAITSRMDGVLHRMDISLSNPVYRIVFVGLVICVFGHEGFACAVVREVLNGGVVGSAEEMGEREEIVSQ